MLAVALEMTVMEQIVVVTMRVVIAVVAVSVVRMVVIIVNVVVVTLVAVLSYRAWIYESELLVGNCNPLVYKYFEIFSN